MDTHIIHRCCEFNLFIQLRKIVSSIKIRILLDLSKIILHDTFI